MRTLISGVVIIFLVSGCSTLQNVVEAREDGKGTVEVYDVNMDDAWMLAKKSFRWGGSDAIEEYKEEQDITRIRALIIVERNSQKGIIIGKGGDMLKRIGYESRKEMEKFIDQKVFLETFVKVDKDWRASEQKLKKYGY